MRQVRRALRAEGAPDPARACAQRPEAVRVRDVRRAVRVRQPPGEPRAHSHEREAVQV